MTRPPPAIAAFGVSKAFGPTQALQGASLEVAAGEVHALLGENGSGKSTFVKILAGIHDADRGRVERDGNAMQLGDPLVARSAGIGIVFQELSLAPDLTVAENMFLGRELRTRGFGWVDKSGEAEACRTMLARLGMAIEPQLQVGRLSMAEKQLVEIGKALLLEPAILVFDEPTASLTEREISRLFDVIRQLRAAGKAILYVTHHLREVLQIADRVSVMRDGKIVASEVVTKDTSETDLIALLTEKRLQTNARPVRQSAPTSLLSIAGFSSIVCTEVSLHVDPGEIVGLYGVVGCGREEISRAIVGLHRPLAGEIALLGKPVRFRNPADALGHGVAFLASDRKQDGILPNRSIRENLMLSRLRSLAQRGILRRANENAVAEADLAMLRVKYASAEDLILSLSGGNQQKVLFGRALGAAPKLLVLEDPTAGIDIGSKYDLYEHMRRSADRGTSQVWLSSDIRETLTLCDRVYAMYAGQISAEIRFPSLADEGQLLAAVLGQTNERAHA